MLTELQAERAPPGAEAFPQHFDFAGYFLGRTRGYGVLETRGGAVRRQFVVDIIGRREGERLELIEQLAFDDGEILDRSWSIATVGKGRFEATAPDVDGLAIGTTEGNALRWRYVLRLPVGKREVRLAMDDRMILLGEGVLLSRVLMSKWGFGIGSMTVSYRRLD